MRPLSLRGLEASTLVLAVVSGLALLALSASGAEAGLGDLVKSKAKEIAGKKATPTPVQQPEAESNMTFDEVTLELGSARIAQMLKGVRAGESATVDRGPLVTRRDQMQNQAGELMNRYGRDIDAARSKRDAVADCIDQELNQRAHQRQAEMEQKARTDPAMLARMMELGQKMAMAQASGDTATWRVVQTELMGLTQPSKEDSAAARQKCGPLPKPHTMAARVDSLQTQVAVIDRQLREQDEKSMEAQVAASGLTEEQMAMAKERALLYLQAVASGRKANGFSKTELAALEEKRSELQSALGKYLN